MKKLQAIIVIIFLSIDIHAQKSEDAISSENTESNEVATNYLNSAKHAEMLILALIL